MHAVCRLRLGGGEAGGQCVFWGAAVGLGFTRWLLAVGGVSWDLCVHGDTFI